MSLCILMTGTPYAVIICISDLFSSFGEDSKAKTNGCLSSGSMHDNDPELLEREKNKNLKGEQYESSSPHKHAPGWNEYLASTSEAYTKVSMSLSMLICVSYLEFDHYYHASRRHECPYSYRSATNSSTILDAYPASE